MKRLQQALFAAFSIAALLLGSQLPPQHASADVASIPIGPFTSSAASWTSPVVNLSGQSTCVPSLSGAGATSAVVTVHGSANADGSLPAVNSSFGINGVLPSLAGNTPGSVAGLPKQIWFTVAGSGGSLTISGSCGGASLTSNTTISGTVNALVSPIPLPVQEQQGTTQANVGSDGSRETGGSQLCGFSQVASTVDGANTTTSCIMEAVTRNSLLNPSGTWDRWRSTGGAVPGIGAVSVCDPFATPAPSPSPAGNAFCAPVGTNGLGVDISSAMTTLGSPGAKGLVVQGGVGMTPLSFTLTLSTPMPVAVASLPPVTAATTLPVSQQNNCAGYATQSVSKTITTATDTLFVAAPGAGLSVRACHIMLVSQDANVLQPEYGTGAGCVTGRTTFNAPYVTPASMVWGFSEGSGAAELWQVPVANNALCFNSTTTAEEDLWITYSTGV